MGKEKRKMSKASGYLVPTVIEQTGRGERAFDIYSRLLKERKQCRRRSDCYYNSKESGETQRV